MNLKLKDIQVWSRSSESMLTGHLSDMSYFQNGEWKKANIRGGEVRIPLDGIQCRQYAGGCLMVSVLIEMMSNVGPQHMPRSKALLVIWM